MLDFRVKMNLGRVIAGGLLGLALVSSSAKANSPNILLQNVLSSNSQVEYLPKTNTDFFSYLDSTLNSEKNKKRAEVQERLSRQYSVRRNLVDPFPYFIDEKDSTITFFYGLARDSLSKAQTRCLLRGNHEESENDSGNCVTLISPPYSDSSLFYLTGLIQRTIENYDSSLAITSISVTPSEPPFLTVNWLWDHVFDLKKEDGKARKETLEEAITKNKVPLVSTKIKFKISK